MEFLADEPIAYMAGGAIYCPDCARKIWGELDVVEPIAPWDQWWSSDPVGPERLVCEACGQVIEEFELADLYPERA